jgi:TetR/AcrR family transcriptional regulator
MTTAVAPQPTARRRQARSEATRTALLDAALHEFAAHGFEGASTRAIATRAGTHQPQINYHFDSKHVLWLAAVEHLFTQLDEAMRRHTPDDVEPGVNRASFAAGIRALVRAVAELPELNRIMVQEATIGSDRLATIVDQYTRPRYELLAGDWRTLRDRGEVVEIDETVFYYSLIGAASLPYVNSPQAQLLGLDTTTDEFVEAHANALILLFLGPDDWSDS